MKKADEVEEIQRLKKLNLSQRAVARAMSIDVRTVRRYWYSDPDNLPVIRRNKQSALAKYDDQIRSLFRIHRNVDVVRQEMEKKYRKKFVLRTLQHYIKPYREQLKRELMTQAKLVKRIETPPGEFMQIDFGERSILLGGRKQKVHFFVATMAYSRRRFVKVCSTEKQDDWLGSIEEAFLYFGGIPRFLVCDNPKAMVKEAAKKRSRLCQFNPRFVNFCTYWNVVPIACYPRYPQSKGKVERSVSYVKANAIAGHHFKDFTELTAHLRWWMLEVSDVRVMRDLIDEEEKVPLKRFEKEKLQLRPADKPPFLSIRELVRKVDVTGRISIDTRQYQMDAQYVGIEVRVLACSDHLKVFLGEKLITTFNKTRDAVKATTFTEVTEHGVPNFGATDIEMFRNSLLRPLSVYNEVAGGNW